MALFCPDAVVWGDIGTWVGAGAVALVTWFSYRLSSQASRSQRVMGEMDSYNGLWHAFVAVDNAIVLATPHGTRGDGDVVRAFHRIDHWEQSSVASGALLQGFRSRSSMKVADAVLLSDAVAAMRELSEFCVQAIEDQRMLPCGEEAVTLMGAVREKLRVALDRFASITGRPGSSAAESSGRKLAAALSKA